MIEMTSFSRIRAVVAGVFVIKGILTFTRMSIVRTHDRIRPRAAMTESPDDIRLLIPPDDVVDIPR